MGQKQRGGDAFDPLGLRLPPRGSTFVGDSDIVIRLYSITRGGGVVHTSKGDLKKSRGRELVQSSN